MGRQGAPGRPAKKRPGKMPSSRPKRGNTTRAKRGGNRSGAELQEQISSLTRELAEALEQQTATSEILRVISNSKTDIQPVFKAIAASATRLCDAVNSLVIRFDGRLMHLVAQHNVIPERLDTLERLFPLPPSRGSVSGRSILSRVAVQVEDITRDREYMLPTATTFGYRTALAVPMLHDDIPIGVMVVARDRVAPFSGKQIALLQTFASQAVIAIENVRLFEAEQHRTRELAESLEQQTATSEILASMSDSMTDSKPVFDAIVRNLLRLFGTRFATVQLLKDGMVHLAALEGEPGFERLADRFPVPLDDSTLAGRTMLSKRIARLTPVIGNVATPAATERNARDFGYNSMIFAPMLRADEVIGAIGTAHRDAKAFDDKQAALIKAFADQAVIAIENVRLFEAEQQRTRELAESLEQQTATSEVLRVISSSPRRVAADIFGDAGECSTHLRGKVRLPVANRRRRIPARRIPRPAAGPGNRVSGRSGVATRAGSSARSARALQTSSPRARRQDRAWIPQTLSAIPSADRHGRRAHAFAGAGP